MIQRAMTTADEGNGTRRPSTPMRTRGLAWVVTAGLGSALGGCADDVTQGPGSEGSSSGSLSTGEPGSTSDHHGSSAGPADTTQGPPATESGTTSTPADSGTTAEPGTTADSGTTAELGTTAEPGSTSDASSTGVIEPEVEPTARADVACMLRQQPGVVVDVLANDFDPQGSPLVLVSHDPITSAGGTVVQVAGGLSYAPAPGFWGEDVIGYVIADPDGHEAMGQAHVMVWPGTIEATELVAGSHGLSISPDAEFGRLGWSLSGGGDLDGDGLDDVVVSAPFAGGGLGRTYVVFGQPDPAPVELAAVAAGDGGYVLTGNVVGEYAGWSVAVLDDLDGDGRNDLAVGAGWANANGSRSGRVTVVFSQAFGSTQALSAVVGVDAFTITGAFAEDWAGWAVASTEDMNGDGIGEVLVGAPQATDVLPGAPGRAYVVFGKGDVTPVSLASVLGGSGAGFAMLGQAGDHVGMSVAGLPDLDDDGMPEVLVGSETAAGGAGRAYVVHGHAGASTVSLTAVMNEVGGYGLEGLGPGVALGRSGAGIGDLDGDGLPELMVAAPGPALAGDAAVHVLEGSNASSMVLGTPMPDQGTTIGGVLTGDNLGWSVATLPDWNGDGLPDLALGAPSAGGDFGPGAVYVVFGRPDMSTVDLDDIAAGRGGFVVVGEDWDDDAGFRVASAGDFDGDGSTDLLLGAPQAEPLGSFSGRAYVVLGVAASSPELGACVPD